MANSNANFVDYHSKIKTFNLFNIFYHDYEKYEVGIYWKVEEKISDAEKWLHRLLCIKR